MPQFMGSSVCLVWLNFLEKMCYTEYLEKEQKKAVAEMNENLWKLLEMAKADAALLAALEATRKEADPALALCTLATEKAFPLP